MISYHSLPEQLRQPDITFGQLFVEHVYVWFVGPRRLVSERYQGSD